MPHINKRILDRHRLRVLPHSGFSWVDRRFIRNGFADRLSAADVSLYFFLCAVADRDGLSFFGDVRISSLLKISSGNLDRARRTLVYQDLIRFERPLYQVLALPKSELELKRSPAGVPRLVSEILEGRANDQ